MDSSLRDKYPDADAFDTPEDAVRAARAANSRLPADFTGQPVRDNLVQREDGRWVWRYDGAGVGNFIPSAPSEADQWAALARVPCPALIVRGGVSPFLSRDVAERMEGTVSKALLVELPNTGHALIQENPSGFLEAARPFLLESD